MATTVEVHMISTMVEPEQILVVDDEPMVREVVVAYLEREGFRVNEAATGRAALQRIAETRPDLVVLDVMLPEIDGFSVLTELRRSGDIPVILLTARTEEPDRVLGLELGADDYVVKPFSHASWLPECAPCFADRTRRRNPLRSSNSMACGSTSRPVS